MISNNTNSEDVSRTSINLKLMILFGAFSAFLILFLFNNNLAIFDVFKLNLYNEFPNWIQNGFNFLIQSFYPKISSLIIAVLLLITVIILHTNPLNWRKNGIKTLQITLTILSFTLIFAFVMSKIASISSLRNSATEQVFLFSSLVVAFEMLAIVIFFVLIFIIYIHKTRHSSSMITGFTFNALLISMLGLLGAGSMFIVSEYSFENSFDLFKKCYIAGSILVQFSMFLLLLAIGIEVVKSIISLRIKIHTINSIAISILMLLSYLLRITLLLIYNLVEDFPTEQRYYRLLYVNSTLYYLSLASFICLLIMGLYTYLKSERFIFKKTEYEKEINRSISIGENAKEFSKVNGHGFNEEQQTTEIKGSDIQQRPIELYFSVFLVLSIVFYFILSDNMLNKYYSTLYEGGRTATLIFTLSIILLGIVWRKKTQISEKPKLLHNFIFALLILAGACSLTAFILYKFAIPSYRYRFLSLSSFFENLIDIMLFFVSICSIILLRRKEKYENMSTALLLGSIGLVLNFILPFLSGPIIRNMSTSRPELEYLVIYLPIAIGSVIVFSAAIPVIRNRSVKNGFYNFFTIGIVLCYIFLRIVSLILITFYPPEIIEELSFVFPPILVNFTTSLPLICKIVFFFILFLASFSLILKLNYKGIIAHVSEYKKEYIERVTKKRIDFEILIQKFKRSYRNAAKFWVWKGIEFVIVVAILSGTILGIASHYRIAKQNTLYLVNSSLVGGTSYDTLTINHVYFDDLSNSVYLEISSSEKIEVTISYSSHNQQRFTVRGTKTIKFRYFYSGILITTESSEIVQIRIKIYETIITMAQKFAIYSPMLLGMIWMIFASIQIIKRKRL